MDKNKIPQNLELKRVPGGHSFFYSKLLDYQSDLQSRAASQNISLAEIVESLGLQSHELLLLFLCLPFLQPIPLPGLSTPLGLLMMLIAPYEFSSRQPWIPMFFQKKKINKINLIKLISALALVWTKIEDHSKRRFLFFIRFPLFRSVNFLVIMICAFLLALPLPIPFTNSLPAFVIFLNQLGQIEDDGLIVFASYLAFGVTAFYFSLLGLSAQQVFVFFSYDPGGGAPSPWS